MTDDEVDAALRAAFGWFSVTDQEIMAYRAGLAAIPREPTEHMITAGREAWIDFEVWSGPATEVGNTSAGNVWRAMYDAAQGGRP